jgi:hypothetical protein
MLARCVIRQPSEKAFAEKSGNRGGQAMYDVRCVSRTRRETCLSVQCGIVARLSSNTTVLFTANATCFDGKLPSSGVLLQNLDNQGRMFLFARSLRQVTITFYEPQ